MRKITSLKQQQRNKERISVFLDDEFAFGLPMIVAAELRLGQTLSEEKIKDLLERATVEAAKSRALNFISYRPRSSAEIRRNLAKKAFEEPAIEQAIAFLKRIDMLDDLKFAEYWIDQRESFKPRSEMALRMELRQKGIAREIIDEALGAVDEEVSARRAAEKRLSRLEHLPKDQFRLKMMRHLQSRGFRYGIIREVTDQLWQELEESREQEE
ncbi:MAG: RecX family transcriptional regulator [Candidatus Promineifilaceae bacterium]